VSHLRLVNLLEPRRDAAAFLELGEHTATCNTGTTGCSSSLRLGRGRGRGRSRSLNAYIVLVGALI
jgi:hypothetical protein